MMKIFYFLFIALYVCTNQIKAQSVIHVENSSGVFLEEGSIVFLDGLSLQPSSGFFLTDFSLQKSEKLPTTVAAKYIRRTYQFSNPVSLFAGTISFHYRQDELNDLEQDDLVLNINNGKTWMFFQERVIRDNNRNFVETVIPSPVDLYLLTLTASINTLPLIWGAVEGFCNNDNIIVKWETLQEENTKEFIVERSIDGRSWASIKKHSAAGHSSSGQKYQIEDMLMNNAEVYYYRIKSIDIDNTYSYSKVIVVKPCGSASNIMVYPVPAVNLITLSLNTGFSAQGMLEVFSISGQKVKSQHVNTRAGQNLIQIDTQAWKAGAYIISILFSNGEKYTVQLTKI